MPSTCHICLEHFEAWGDYHVHLAVRHNVQPTPAEILGQLPKPLAKLVYKGPMTKIEKDRIVLKGEIRLGLHHFIGGGK